MQNTIYKPHSFKDFYVLWSDNTDRPLLWGTEKQMLRYAKKRKYKELFGTEMVENRLYRADHNSTSSRINQSSWDEDEHIFYQGYGYVLRSEVEDFIKVYKKCSDEDDPRIMALVHPWDD